MAILYRAELHPGKLELLTPWVNVQDWAYEAQGLFDRVATYRFDDPAGEVGVETFILRSGDGSELHVPVTYRGAPLEGGEGSLIGTMEHSVLGSRWVYDATGDPVYAQVLASAIIGGGTEVEQIVHTEAGQEIIEPTARVQGSGTGSGDVPVTDAVTASTTDGITTIIADGRTLHVVRGVGDSIPDPVTDSLTGTWEGHNEPVLLAGISTSD